MTLILGIDPGTNATGYGIVTKSPHLKALDYGCIRPPATLKPSGKRLIIYQSVCTLLDQHRPDALAIEGQFVFRNADSAFKLTMVRGVVILAATERDIPVFEYAPSRVKQAVSGSGRATKEKMQLMIQHHLRLKSPPTPHDAADALGLALCHLTQLTCITPFGREA